jgi:hypothetical protein
MGHTWDAFGVLNQGGYIDYSTNAFAAPAYEHADPWT